MRRKWNRRPKIFLSLLNPCLWCSSVLPSAFLPSLCFDQCIRSPMQSSSTQRTCIAGRRGLTLVEALVGIAIFLIISLGIYEGYAGIMRLVGASKIRTLSMLAANEEIELIRNFPYGDVGIEQGIPLGIIPREQTVVKGGVSFLLRTTGRNIDDPFDGTIGGGPHELSPPDFKPVAIDVGCPACKNFS